MGCCIHGTQTVQEWPQTDELAHLACVMFDGCTQTVYPARSGTSTTLEMTTQDRGKLLGSSGRQPVGYLLEVPIGTRSGAARGLVKGVRAVREDPHVRTGPYL